jgi:hypothetical protein
MQDVRSGHRGPTSGDEAAHILCTFVGGYTAHNFFFPSPHFDFDSQYPLLATSDCTGQYQYSRSFGSRQ